MKCNPQLMAGLATWLMALFAVMLPTVVHAQSSKPTLSVEIYQVTGPFTEEQRQEVETYVIYHVKRLQSDEDENVVDARGDLIGPMTKGGTIEFREQYSAIVAQMLDESPIMAETRVLVRLNTMITVEKLIKDDHVLSLIEQGSRDENAAIRYWAARASRVRSTDNIESQLRQRLVDVLQKRLDNKEPAHEDEDNVIRQLLLALVELEAVDAVQQGLNELIQLHIGQAELPFDAKREALQSQLQKLQVMDNQGMPVENAFRQTARAACRYMILITQQAHDEAIERDQLTMVKLCDRTLRVAHARFGSSIAKPDPIESAIFGRNWPRLQATALQWREVLTKPPFNYTDVDLSPAGGGN